MASEVGVSDGLPASAKASWILILIVHGSEDFSDLLAEHRQLQRRQGGRPADDERCRQRETGRDDLPLGLPVR